MKRSELKQMIRQIIEESQTRLIVFKINDIRGAGHFKSFVNSFIDFYYDDEDTTCIYAIGPKTVTFDNELDADAFKDYVDEAGNDYSIHREI